MSFIKGIVGGNKGGTCSRCYGQLKDKRLESERHWGYSGELCLPCYQIIMSDILEFEGQYLERSGTIKDVEGKLFLYLFDKRNTILFKAKKGTGVFKITPEMLTGTRLVTKSAEETKKSFMSSSKPKEKNYLQIEFTANGNNEWAIFDLGSHNETIKNAISLRILDQRPRIPEQTKSFQEQDQISADDEPLTILTARLAKGEITKEEFDDLKEMLS